MVSSHQRPKSKEKKEMIATTEQPNLKTDLKDFLLLVFLYLLQGVPLGLSFGSIPFLLKSKLSYSDIALFSLSSYPYSLKLLWSPIVDSIYFKNIGRRKSWIIPMQTLSSFTLLYLGSTIDKILIQETIPVTNLAIMFTLLVFLSATQDIAVDGWALTLLSEKNKTYASTAQTIGLTTGYFLSFTVFLALNSSEFCNKYLRTEALDVGVVSLGGYLHFWGLVYLACNFWLIFVKKEKREVVDGPDEIKAVYKTIWKVIQTPQMKKFMLILMLAKIGFIANEAVTGLKLLELGFQKEDLALAVLIDFPFQLFFGYYAARWSSGRTPLRPWLYAFYGRLFFAVVGMLVVSSFPTGGVTSWYFFLVIFTAVLSSFMSTVQFVSMGSFFSKISDPLIGGTYMTLLNTLSNLGGTWPKYFVLEAVDYFTISKCTLPDSLGNYILCNTDQSKQLCKSFGTPVGSINPILGECKIEKDGYYFVSSFSVFLGLVSLIVVVRPGILYLEGVKEDSWRLSRKNQE